MHRKKKITQQIVEVFANNGIKKTKSEVSEMLSKFMVEEEKEEEEFKRPVMVDASTQAKH